VIRLGIVSAEGKANPALPRVRSPRIGRLQCRQRRQDKLAPTAVCCRSRENGWKAGIGPLRVRKSIVSRGLNSEQFQGREVIQLQAISTAPSMIGLEMADRKTNPCLLGGLLSAWRWPSLRTLALRPPLPLALPEPASLPDAPPWMPCASPCRRLHAPQGSAPSSRA
jgi:hypothetical protein